MKLFAIICKEFARNIPFCIIKKTLVLKEASGTFIYVASYIDCRDKLRINIQIKLFVYDFNKF